MGQRGWYGGVELFHNKKVHILLGGKLCEKFINRSVLFSTTRTDRTRSVPPVSGTIHQIKYLFRQTYSSGKYPYIEVLRRTYKKGNSRQHSGRLIPINIIRYVLSTGCNNIGRCVRYWKKLQKRNFHLECDRE